MPNLIPVIYPYKINSISAKLLAKELSTRLGKRVKRVRPDGNYRKVVRDNERVINFGSSIVPDWIDGIPYEVVNTPEYVNEATNKVLALSKFNATEVPTLSWTILKHQAEQWLIEGKTVVCRHLLRSSGGKGITLHNEGPLPDAPLYTQYKKKRKEFRVHVFGDNVIEVVEKRKRNGFNRSDAFALAIRNHTNGWVFCRENIQEPPELRSVAILAVKALGLDFGAVDILWNEKENKCYVLEVNTAPGIEGTTVKKYCDAIMEIL